MSFNVDSKIQELREKLEKFKNGPANNLLPKWILMIQQGLIESDLEKLDAIKNERFRVNLKIEIHCEHFGTKEFLINEFELTDENTVKCALLEFKNRKSDPF